MSEAEVFLLTAADGYRIAYRRYLPPEGRRPRGLVVYLHGIQSHGGWYEASSRHLASSGLAVYLPDRRGSGLNKVNRGHADSWELLARDVTDLENLALAEWADAEGAPPLLLLAVSWGGKLAAALAAMHDGRYSGLAMLCPGICPKRGVSPATKLAIAVALARKNEFQKFAIPLADPNLFTATPWWLEFLEHDKLRLREATARFLFESRRLDEFLAEAHRWINVPVLLALAENDRVIDNFATRQYLMKMASRDRAVLYYEKAHHTLEFEHDPSPVFEDLADWLLKRCEVKQ